jgi:hypothetical protein
VRTVELDPLLNDVGVENPSISGGSGGGDGRSYPNHGDPDTPNTCALNYDVLPCDYVMKVVRRDHFQALLATISSRIGSSIANQRAGSQYDGSSILKGSSSSQDPKTGNYTASVTVAPGPDVLDIETIGYSMSWVEMRPTQQLIQQEAKPVFVPLKNTDELKGLMQRALDYGDCKEAVEKIIEQLARKTKTPQRDNHDVMGFFNQMVSDGNIRINVRVGENPPGYAPISGGSGVSFFDKATGARKTWFYLLPGGYENTRSNRIASMPYEYAITGIHEMIHHMAKYTINGETEINDAPKALGFNASLDAYLKSHCVPREFW